MSKSKCKVNADGSVRLDDILNSFDSSIREEHAWALCYQCAKYLDECLQTRRRNWHIVDDVRDIHLQTDGNVHENTVRRCDRQRRLFTNEKDLVTGLGLAVYGALDRGSRHGEERVISPDLEQLITDMVTDESDQTHHETDDEGIERDADDSDEAGPSKPVQGIGMTLQQVKRRCERHLSTLSPVQAEAHYRAVVRALVAEALELSTFLERVAQGSLDLSSDCVESSALDQLKFCDWAKFWVQVMGELRMGVKLKKVNYTRAPIEYELTPYEMLMKDIRSCHYNLRKIMVNGDVPSRVTKDAHAIILEFIRSRPPLKKVSDRKVAPHTRPLTPREQLLLSIKKGRKLRPTPRSTSTTTEAVEPQPSNATRRLIKVDFSQFDPEDCNDESDDPSPIDHSPSSMLPWPHTYYNPLCDETSNQHIVDAYDLATRLGRRRQRQHHLAVGCQSLPQSRPGSRQSCTSSEPDTASTFGDNLTLDDPLSLTLSEIVHVRAVLTQAEVEALPIEGRIRHDVEKRKVCFLCLKTRFGIFGPWGQRCAICKRTVCTRCCAKMNVPLDHFAGVPVVLLSPSIMCTPDGDEGRSLAPSPVAGGSSMASSTLSDPGTSASLNKFRTKAASVGRAARVVDRLKASQMSVCVDCRSMVLQIIEAARANRAVVRKKTLKNMTLDLSPAF